MSTTHQRAQPEPLWANRAAYSAKIALREGGSAETAVPLGLGPECFKFRPHAGPRNGPGTKQAKNCL